MEDKITVPVFCDRKVVMKITLTGEGLTNEEFVEQGVKMLGHKVLEHLLDKGNYANNKEAT